MADTELNSLDSPAAIEVRDAAKREIVVRVVPWGIAAETKAGLEEWQRGALAHVDPSNVVLRLEHENPPAGRGIELDERDDGAYMAFRVSRTQRGDDILALATDGVTRGVSASWPVATEQVEYQMRSGRRVRVVRRADLVELSTTWRPTWNESAVLAVRSAQEAIVANDPQPGTPAPDPADRLTAALEQFAERQNLSSTALIDRVSERMEALEERMRKEIVIPSAGPVKRGPEYVDWLSWAMRTLSGGSVSARELHERDLEDIVTTDNPGLVPDGFRNQLIGAITEGRPFCASTLEIPPPEVGMVLTLPVLSQDVSAAVQSTEKTEIDSTALHVTSESFSAVTIAGGADVSIQMLRRADRSFAGLLNARLNEQYARNCDAQALAALFAAGTTPGAGNIDFEALAIGEAWTNANSAAGVSPDTMWVSGAALAEIIDAKADGTNQALYGGVTTSFSVASPNGSISGLRVVYVPALTGTSVDVIVGPRNQFAWAEDGSLTLQVDVPSRAGRDIAVVGILFFAPLAAAAFTTYDLGS